MNFNLTQPLCETVCEVYFAKLFVLTYKLPVDFYGPTPATAHEKYVIWQKLRDRFVKKSERLRGLAEELQSLHSYLLAEKARRAKVFEKSMKDSSTTKAKQAKHFLRKEKA